MKNYEVIILGGGPAGLSAGIYAARYGLKTLVISREIGGTANLAHTIENYPGYEGSGSELMKKFFEQAKKQGSEFLNDDLISIKKTEEGFEITTPSEKISSKAVIIALGTQRRKLNIPGEDKFLGKGVSYCATCDGIFFKNKVVAIIGGGESACKAVLLMSDLCKKVYLIHRGKIEKCPAETKKMRSRDNVEILSKTIPLEIKGKNNVSEIIIEVGGNKIPREKKIRVEGVFIEVGSLPVSDIAKLLKMRVDKEGFIPVNEHMETSVPGVFSAGDVVKSKMKQVVLSAAQGAVAAKSAYDFLQKS